MVAVVKEWAKRKGINNSSQASFTSYSLVLMVIHYLQAAGLKEKPLLPSLQRLYSREKYFNLDRCITELEIGAKLEPSLEEKWRCKTNYKLGDLLIGFFKYYSSQFEWVLQHIFLFHCLKIWFFWNFPYQYITYRFISFEKDVVSIRLNKPLHRNDFIKHLHSLNQTSWQFVCIEEPFTLSNTAYSIYEERTYLAIKKTFAASLSELETTRDLGELLRESRIFWWIDKVITNKYFHIFCFDLFCCIYICRMDCTKSWRMYMLMSWIKIKLHIICFISFNIIVIPFFVCIV